MDNQHEKIVGHRSMTKTEIDLMNSVKALGEAIREVLAAIDQHIESQENAAIASNDIDELQRLESASPNRWMDDAQASLSKGLMFAVRAVAQPATF